jgi:ribosomal protein L29
VHELASLSNVLFPRQSEIRHLENLLVEARQNLRALAHQHGEEDASERKNVNELRKNIARLKAISRYLPERGRARSPRPALGHCHG